MGCVGACGLRLLAVCCFLLITMGVTPGMGLTKRSASWPLCFTTGFPGFPHGLLSHPGLLRRKSVHNPGIRSALASKHLQKKIFVTISIFATHIMKASNQMDQ